PVDDDANGRRGRVTDREVDQESAVRRRDPTHDTETQSVEREQPFGRSRAQFGAVRGDAGAPHRAGGVPVEQFPAVASPFRRLTAGTRYTPFAGGLGKSRHIHLGTAGFVRDVREPASVRRDSRIVLVEFGLKEGRQVSRSVSDLPDVWARLRGYRVADDERAVPGPIRRIRLIRRDEQAFRRAGP